MLNQVVLVGRIAKEVEVKELEGDKKVSEITLAIPRSFKNEEGAYDTDLVNITLWDSIAENVKEYCRKGDIVGIKGRVQDNNSQLEIVADRVSFLSSKKEESNENN